MATFTIGPAPDATTVEALLDAVQSPQPMRTRIAAMHKITLQPSVFARAELAKLTRNESLVDQTGRRFRPLDSWLVEPSRFADAAGDDAGIRVRVRTAGLVVEIPRRPFDEAPALLPVDTDGTGRPALSAALRLTDGTGAVAEHAMLAEVDAESGRVHLELPFPQPELRFAVLDAVNEGRAAIALSCTHAIAVANEPMVIGPLLLRPLVPRILPAIVHRLQLNRTNLSVAAKGTATLPLQVTGDASCDVSLSWTDAQVSLQATLTGPDGTVRARAAGHSPLSLDYEIDGSEAGDAGWVVSIHNATARQVTCAVSHNLPRRRPKVVPRPPADPTGLLRGVARMGHLGGLMRVVIPSRPSMAVLEVMPDATSQITVPARGRVDKLFSGPAARGIVEARATWPGAQHLTMEIRGANDAVLASVASGSGAWLRVKPAGGAVAHRVSLRNDGAQPLQVSLGHTPGALSDPAPQGAPAIERHEARLELRLDLPRASHGWVYPDAESDETWQPVALAALNQTVHVRASADLIGQYFYFPEEFRLGFMADSTLPALDADLTKDEAAGEDAVDGGYRIEATLVAVPWTSPRRREALREHLQKTRDLPFCALALASGLPARLQLLDADGEPTAVTIFLDRGLVLPLHMPARRYNLLASMLQSPAGVGGAVVVTLPDGGELPIPLRLSLSAIAVNSVQTISRGGAGAIDVQLTNVCDEPLTVQGVNVWRLRSGSIGFHDAQKVATIESLALAPDETTRLTLAEPERPGLDELVVEQGDATIAGVDAVTWLERIHRQAASLPSSELTVQVIGSAELGAAGFSGIALQLVLPGGHPGAATFLSPEQSQWTTNVVHELAAYAAGTAGLDGVVAEYRASFASGEGLLQRVPVTGPVLVLRAPGAEQPDSHYELSVLDAQGQTVRSEVHPRAGMEAALAAVREEGLFWRLRVVAAPEPEPEPEPEPVEPEPVEPVEPVTPTPAAEPIVVVARLLDFDALARVFLTITPEDASAGSEVMSITSAGELRWQPSQGRPAPFSWEATFIFADGTTRSLSGTESQPLLVLDMPG